MVPRDAVRNDIDLRLVRAFVTVAEEGTVTNAARRLHLAQQALSSQILRLERRLGMRLFDRMPSGMQLTPAGQAFLAESRRTLEQARRAVEAASQAEPPRGGGRVAVAYKARATAHFVGGVVDLLTERHPELTVELFSVNTLEEEVAAVRGGLADAAFVWLPTGADDLHHQTVGEEPWLVAVAPDHRLVDRDEVTLAELADDPVVGPHDTVPDAVTATWIADPRPDGRPAVRGPVARTPEDCLQQVSAGHGVWFAPESVSGYFSRPPVSWVAVTDMPPATLAVAHRAAAPGPEIQAVVDLARTCG